MGGFISSDDGSYYVNDRQGSDLEVPLQPSEHHQWVGGEWVLDQVAALAAKIKVMDDAIKQRLNDKAVEMNFYSIASAILAASLPLGEYRQADGAKLHLWSARTWQKAEQIRDAFLAGERIEPTWEEVQSELPTYPIE